MKLYTSAAIARRLDMTERNVRSLRDKGVIREYRPGLYDLGEVTVQYINFLRKNNPEAEEKVDYKTERAKLIRAKRESQELELRACSAVSPSVSLSTVGFSINPRPTTFVRMVFIAPFAIGTPMYRSLERCRKIDRLSFMSSLADPPA